MNLDRLGDHLRGGAAGDYALRVAWSEDPARELEGLPAHAIRELDPAHAQALGHRLSVEPRELTIGHLTGSCPGMLSAVLQAHRARKPPVLEHLHGLVAALHPRAAAA